MEQLLQRYLQYMSDVRNASNNTLISYERDIHKMIHYFEQNGIEDCLSINTTNINSYILKLEKDGSSPATLSRTIASMRSFFRYLFQRGLIKEEPTWMIQGPVVEKKTPKSLTIKQIEQLLNQPNTSNKLGIRDKAMLELMYSTGIRVSELLQIKTKNINLQFDYLVCESSSKKDRVIPFGTQAKKAIMEYLSNSRGKLIKEDTEYLFLSCQGKPMTRQGFWKIIKQYGTDAGIDCEITPQILRHSFAQHMIKNGAILSSVQELMGFSSISSTQIYMDKKLERIREEYKKAHPRQ